MVIVTRLWLRGGGEGRMKPAPPPKPLHVPFS